MGGAHVPGLASALGGLTALALPGMSVRGVMKGAVERGLRWSGVAALTRRRRRNGTLILAYHNIVSDDAQPRGDRSLHLPRARFAAQLDALRRTHDVVSLEAALEAPAPGATKPRAVITFDDAYSGALGHGVPELVARRLPATIFVAPRYVGGHPFWWDSLSGAHPDGLAPEIRVHGIARLGGCEDRIREWAKARGVPSADVPPEMRCATEEELSVAARAPAITLGSHSWSHLDLSQLSREELDEELARPLAWLRERYQAVVPYLSYPYGLSSPEVEEATRAAGYRAALRVSGGWAASTVSGRYALPRLNVPSGLSANGFALRASGLFCE